MKSCLMLITFTRITCKLSCLDSSLLVLHPFRHGVGVGVRSVFGSDKPILDNLTKIDGEIQERYHDFLNQNKS